MKRISDLTKRIRIRAYGGIGKVRPFKGLAVPKGVRIKRGKA